MEPRRGPTLEVDRPTAAELDWIEAALQAPEVFLPLSFARPPSRAQIESGRLELIDPDGRGLHSAEFLVVRRRETGAPVAFWLHYGWELSRDPSRELDLAIPRAEERSLGTFLEAHILVACFMFGHGLAKRLRWRVAQAGARPLRWYARLGARNIGRLEEPHPVTGEPQTKQVYEISKREFLKVLERAGGTLETDYATWGIAMWDLLRATPKPGR